MKSTVILCMACMQLSVRAQSPITITGSHMPGNGDTLRYTEVMLNSLGNYTATGTNFAWDFSSATRLTEGVRSFKSALLTPYAFFFLAQNEFGEKVADTIGLGPFQLTNLYTYYRKTSQPVNAYLADGVGITLNGIKVPCYYSDKEELYLFPLTFQKYDSTKFRFQTPSTVGLPLTYSKSGYRVTKVDGWGTVTTPFGTEQCLRIVTTQYANDTIKNPMFPFPFGFPNFVRSYQWLTLTSKIPFFEVTGTLLGSVFTPASARYRGFEKKSEPVDTHLGETLENRCALFPNPTSDLLHIPGNHAGEIYTADGRLVMRFSGERTDVSRLPAGVFVVRTEHGAVMRFVKSE